MVSSIQIWAEQNRVNEIKNESTLKIYVKCEGGISKYDKLVVMGGGYDG